MMHASPDNGEIKILAQDTGISEQIPRRAGRQTQ